jgi:hypothetical protein
MPLTHFLSHQDGTRTPKSTLEQTQKSSLRIPSTRANAIIGAENNLTFAIIRSTIHKRDNTARRQIQFYIKLLFNPVATVPQHPQKRGLAQYSIGWLRIRFQVMAKLPNFLQSKTSVCNLTMRTICTKNHFHDLFVTFFFFAEFQQS